MNIKLLKSFLIVLISSLITSWFISSLFELLGENNSTSLIDVSVLVIFLGIWILYSLIVSKMAKKQFFEILIKDANSFLPAIVLLLFLFAPIIANSSTNLPIGFENFPLLIFAKLLMILALTLFIAIKVLRLPPNLFEAYHKKTKSKFTAMHLTFFVGIIFFIIISWMQIANYFSFNIPAPDLWIFNQSFWNTINGDFMYSTRLHGNYLTVDHFAIFLVFLVPFYAIFQSPISLLILQTIFITLSIIPIYLIAKKQFDCKFAGFSFAAAFLAFPALTFIALRHFHPIALSIPLILFAFYFLQENKIKPFFVFILLSLMVHETVSLTIFFLGMWIAFVKKQKKLGLIVSAIALIWFILVIFFIIPTISGSPYKYLSNKSPLYSQFGTEPVEIISNIAINPVNTLSIIFTPQKLAYLASLIIPMAILSIFSLPALLIALPVFGQNLLSSSLNQASIYFQYNSIIIVFLFISAIYGLQNLINFLSKWFDKKMLLRAGLFAILTASFFGAVFLGSTPLSLLDPIEMPTKFEPKEFIISEHDKVLWQAISMIPREAEVRSESVMLVQTSSRKENDYFPFQFEKSDYILLDMSVPEHESALFPEKVQELKNNSNWEIVFEKDKVLLFKKTKNN